MNSIMKTELAMNGNITNSSLLDVICVYVQTGIVIENHTIYLVLEPLRRRH